MTTADFYSLPTSLQVRLSRLVRSRKRSTLKLTEEEWGAIFGDSLDTSMDLGECGMIPLHPGDDERRDLGWVGFYGSIGPRGSKTYVARSS